MSTTEQLLTYIAREHLSIPTLKPRKSDSLDFHTVSVWGTKKALRAAFVAGARSVAPAPDRSQIDIRKLLSERHQVAIIWGTEDVLELRPDLTEDQAWEVLQQCEDVHDCELGFNWFLIETVVKDMYPKPIKTTDKGDGQ